MENLEEKFNDCYYKVLELIIKQSVSLKEIKNIEVPIIPSLYVFSEPEKEDDFNVNAISINILEPSFLVAMKLGTIALFFFKERKKPFCVYSVMPIITTTNLKDSEHNKGIIITGSTLDKNFTSSYICSDIKNNIINPLTFQKNDNSNKFQFENDFFHYITLLINLLNQFNFK